MNLFKEKCPRCDATLKVKKQLESKTIIVKVCPSAHYEKEFHPALETYIETYRIS
ncbi:hypothetical protein QNH36_12215 [Mesobacillus sp. AQ2]|jgi:DNA-directed RNA polymerase subunit M/transcription elongation factor TFIIS|uniref:hypothetical protein n=1 Tax=Bacillaceae TaxID=186817 RepID=UPI001642EEAC|nr:MULTISPECIES: hypothetical protein [Bacillaceae]WHX38475.1 hypothetical protein QNH36_12215 [Mesobacillus sp. AQ2]